MADFYGSNFRLPGSHWLLREYDDQMHGTSFDDTFYAGGGNDTIYAGLGDDAVYAGSGNDTIYATDYRAPGYVGPWGNDAVYAGDGDDHINYGNTTSNVILFGDNTAAGAHDGNDTIVSGAGNDWIYGGGGNDFILGGAGSDVIYGDMPNGNARGDDVIFGGDGNDSIYGGAGNDVIYGGRDVDYMYGGSGADTFKFNAVDTGLHYADADVIYDFKPSFDRGFPGAGDTINFVTVDSGTSRNFGHTSIDTSHEYTYAAEYEHALKAANATEASNSNLKYVFVTDGQDGWLFVDTNGDHHLDAGIELRGVTDMHYWNVV